MKKIITSNIFRALCSLLIGLLLVVNAERMPGILVQIIGGLFVLSASFTLVNYLLARFSSKVIVKPSFPLSSLGSCLFGIYLIAFSEIFLSYLIIILGVVLVLAGISQIIAGISYQKVAPISIITLLLPAVLVVLGGYVIIHPLDSAAMTFTILGCACIYYGLLDLFLALRYRHYERIYTASEKRNNTPITDSPEGEYVDFEEVKEGE